MAVAEWVPLIALGLGGAAAGILGVMAYRANDAARIIAANPPRPISEINAGPIEVKGVLHGEGKVEGQVTQRPALYARVVIEQYRRNQWEPVLDRKEAALVWLDDGSGRVFVSPKDAQVIVATTRRVQAGIYEVPSPVLTGLLERLGEQPEILGPFVRWREEVLEDGDVLHAVGAARKDDDGNWEIHGADTFHVISDRDDAEVIRVWQRRARMQMAGAVLGLAVAFWGLLQVL